MLINLKNKPYSKLIADFFWIFGGNISSIIGILAVIKILSFFLTPNEYGQYYLGITLTIFANQIFFGPLGNAFTRYYIIAEKKNSINVFLNSTYNIAILLTKILSIIAIIFFIFLYFFYKIGNFYFYFNLFIISIFTGYSSIIYAYFHITLQRKKIAIYQTIESLIKILIISFFLYQFQKTTNNILFAISISTILTFALQFHFLYKNEIDFSINNRILDKEWKKYLFEFSYPFAIWGIFCWLQISSDRWFLGYFKSSEDVAKYAIIFQLGYYPPSIIIGNVVQTITPILYRKAGDASETKMLLDSSNVTKKITFLSFLITFLVFIFSILFSKIIIDTFSNSRYIELANYFPYMVLSGGIFATAQILSIDFQSRMKINLLLYIKIITAIIGVISSFLLIKFFGLIGSVISSIWFSSIYLFAIIYFSKWFRIKK
jgi:O-antigen/teichoic acid export membrane protein